MSNHMTDLREKLLPVRLLMLDVDGVLTDGSILIDDEGRESKRFHVRDGHGLKMLMKLGIDVVIATGRVSRALVHRALDLGVREVYQGVRDKRGLMETIGAQKGLSIREMAFMGDDIVDVAALRQAGFAATVADAEDAVKAHVHFVTRRAGGRGAVREICDLLIQAQGRWPEVEAEYEL
jgi:3-deoxy-D-manno-octulosonate 8-phosphate phosphatase (KDO 8-P phosphatase)